LPANVTICSLHLFRNCFLPSITSGMWVISKEKMVKSCIA
jgi:hypothetical protein